MESQILNKGFVPDHGIIPTEYSCRNPARNFLVWACSEQAGGC